MIYLIALILLTTVQASSSDRPEPTFDAHNAREQVAHSGAGGAEASISSSHDVQNIDRLKISTESGWVLQELRSMISTHLWDELWSSVIEKLGYRRDTSTLDSLLEGVVKDAVRLVWSSKADYEAGRVSREYYEDAIRKLEGNLSSMLFYCGGDHSVNELIYSIGVAKRFFRPMIHGQQPSWAMTPERADAYMLNIPDRDRSREIRTTSLQALRIFMSRYGFSDEDQRSLMKTLSEVASREINPYTIAWTLNELELQAIPAESVRFFIRTMMSREFYSSLVTSVRSDTAPTLKTVVRILNGFFTRLAPAEQTQRLYNLLFGYFYRHSRVTLHDLRRTNHVNLDNLHQEHYAYIGRVLEDFPERLRTGSLALLLIYNERSAEDHATIISLIPPENYRHLNVQQVIELLDPVGTMFQPVPLLRAVHRAERTLELLSEISGMNLETRVLIGLLPENSLSLATMREIAAAITGSDGRYRYVFESLNPEERNPESLADVIRIINALPAESHTPETFINHLSGRPIAQYSLAELRDELRQREVRRTEARATSSIDLTQQQRSRNLPSQEPEDTSTAAGSHLGRERTAVSAAPTASSTRRRGHLTRFFPLSGSRGLPSPDIQTTAPIRFTGSVTGQEALSSARHSLVDIFHRLMERPGAFDIFPSEQDIAKDFTTAAAELRAQIRELIEAIPAHAEASAAGDQNPDRFRFEAALRGLDILEGKRAGHHISSSYDYARSSIAGLPTIHSLFVAAYRLSKPQTLHQFAQAIITENPRSWPSLRAMFSDKFPHINHPEFGIAITNDRKHGYAFINHILDIAHGKCAAPNHSTLLFVRSLLMKHKAILAPDAARTRLDPIIEALVMVVRGHNERLLDPSETDRPACSEGAQLQLILALSLILDSTGDITSSLQGIRIKSCGIG